MAGNHDLALDEAFYAAHGARAHNHGLHTQTQRDDNAAAARAMMRENKLFTYLEHEAKMVEVREGVRVAVLGSPWSRRIGEVGTWAFGYADGDEAEARWSDIPVPAESVGGRAADGYFDILISHGPPKGICDVDRDGRSDGCEALLKALGRIKPRLVVCGHRHEGRGCAVIEWNSEGGVKRIFRWKDVGTDSGKLSLVDLTGKKGSWLMVRENARLEENDEARYIESDGSKPPSDIDDTFSLVGLLKDSSRSWTCVVNSAIMAHSYGGPKQFNKPIVVDIELGNG